MRDPLGQWLASVAAATHLRFANPRQRLLLR
jgi:hypothetical protein